MADLSPSLFLFDIHVFFSIWLKKNGVRKLLLNKWMHTLGILCIYHPLAFLLEIIETKIRNKQSSFFHLDEVGTLLNMSRMLMESLLALKKVSRFCQADPALSAPFPSILSSLKQQVKIKGYRYLVFYLEGIPIFL